MYSINLNEWISFIFVQKKSIEEQVVMFLHVLAHHSNNRVIGHLIKIYITSQGQFGHLIEKTCVAVIFRYQAID